MWVENMKNGKFRFAERYKDYMTGKTKKVSVVLEKNTPQSRKVAQKILSEKIENASNAPIVKSVTFGNLVSKYLDYQKTAVKPSTYSRNRFACNTLTEIFGGDVVVDKLTAKYIKDKLLSTGKASGTLNEYLKRLKALIRWGYQNDYIFNISFLDKIEPFNDTPHKIKIQDKYLEADELKALLSGMHLENWKLLTQFLALSGLRFGEAAALTLSDVDFDNRLIHVTKTYDMVNNVVTSPKTLCSIRDVFCQDELFEVCRSVKICMLRQSIIFGYGRSNLFFQSADGTHVNYYAYGKYLRYNSMKLLGRAITPHALRHTHASLLLEHGIPIDTISRRLGHENSQVTREIYLHVTEKLKEKDNQKIAKVKIM